VVVGGVFIARRNVHFTTSLRGIAMRSAASCGSVVLRGARPNLAIARSGRRDLAHRLLQRCASHGDPLDRGGPRVRGRSARQDEAIIRVKAGESEELLSSI
jgi:hypothetical protein